MRWQADCADNAMKETDELLLTKQTERASSEG
jgi:hypothetical protein